MLTMLAWIPRVLQWFGLFRGMVGAVGSVWPYVSTFIRKGGARALRAA